jgi:2'-5' RNA ligase
MLPTIYDVTSKTKPFAVTTTQVTTFPAGDDGVPVIARIESPPLQDFRQALVDAFDEADLEFDKKFPDYKPHATLAYAPDPETKVNFEIPELTWGVSELVLWGSNRGEGRLVVRFPLSLTTGKTASQIDRSVLYRAVVKLAAWSLKDQYV